MSDPLADPAPSNVLRRPESQPGSRRTRGYARLRQWGRDLVAQLKDRRTQPAVSTEFDFSSLEASEVDLGPRERIPLAAFTAGIVIGGSLLIVGSLWAWQSWSQRSAEPIDDLLPLLTTSDVGDIEAGAVEGTRPAEVPLINAAAAPALATGPSAEPAGGDETPTPPTTIIVHVSGAVEAPGVVELASGARVYEAVAEAGGAVTQADLDRVNLAAPLSDGERIHVPRFDEEVLPEIVQSVRPTVPEQQVEDQAAADAQIDINAASVAELQMLPGVGPSIAEAIVQTREQRGPFFTVDELLEVPGIGDAKLAALRPQAVVVVP